MFSLLSLSQTQWDGLTGQIIINRTDGLRKEFDLDVISLKEDGLEKVNSLTCVHCAVLHDCQFLAFLTEHNVVTLTRHLLFIVPFF